MGLETKIKKNSPKYKEYILSVAEPIKNELTIAFRDIETGEQTAYSLKDWLHPFVVWPKIKQNADLHFNKADIKNESLDILNQLEDKISNLMPHIGVRRFERAFPTLHAYLPIKAKPLVEKLVRELEFTTVQKNIFDLPIEIPAFYKDVIRNTFGEAGDIVKIDTRYFDILKQKKKLEQEFNNLSKEISERFEGKVTRQINKLHEIFTKYDSTNYEDIKKELFNDNHTKKLKDFWEQRKELADEVFDLDKRLENINPANSAFFHDRNKETSGSKDYSLDTLIADSDIFKERRKMTGDELRNQVWVSIDVEKPLYKYKDEAEVSWITLVYHKNGEILKKETHTLRDPNLKKRGDRFIYSYKNYDSMLKGVNNSINKMNPYACSSYNANYDFRQTRDGSDEDFAIGAKGEEPKVKSSTKFFEKIGLRGKIIFDQLRWAQMFFPHLPNKKLNLIAKIVLGEDAFDKIINYDQMEIFERIAIDYNYYYKHQNSIGEDITSLIIKEAKVNSISDIKLKKLSMYASRVIESYVSSDTEILPKMLYSYIGRETLNILLDFCQRFNISIQELVTYNNISKKHKWNFFEKTGIPSDFMFPKHNKNLQTAEVNALNRLKILKNKMIKSSNKPGLHKNVYHVYVPFSNAFLDMFEFRENTKELTQKFPKEYNSLTEKYFYSNMIEAFMRAATIDYMEILKNQKKLEKDPITNVIISSSFKKAYDKFLTKLEQGRKEHIPFDNKFEISRTRIDSYTNDADLLKNGNLREDILKAYACYEFKISDDKKQKGSVIGSFLNENKINLDDFLSAVKLTAKNKSPEVLIKYNKSVKRFFGKLLKDPYDFEILFEDNYKTIDSFLNPEKNDLQNFSGNIQTFLKKNGFDVIYKNGNYLYLIGENEDSLLDLNSPLVYIDKIPSVYIDGDSSESKQKICYPKHGYWHGIKIKDHPDNNVSLYEMDLFGGFLNDMMDSSNKFPEFEYKRKNALQTFKEKLTGLFDGGLNNNEMCTFVKSKEAYVAHINGKKTEFQNIEKLNSASIDVEAYTKKILTKAEIILKPICSAQEIATLLRKDLSEVIPLHKKRKPKKQKFDLQSSLF